MSPVAQTASAQKYTRPPIIEGIIEILVAKEIETKLQEKVISRLKTTYPHSSKRQAVNIKVDTTAESVSVEQEPQGYRLTNEDQTDVVLVLPRGLGVVRLAPYMGWDALRQNAYDAWKVWKANTPGYDIQRLGVRYINRIDIPINKAEKLNLNDYLSLYPKVAPVLSKPISGYLMQVAAPTRDDRWSTTITSTLVQPPPLVEHISILLDIDVFRTEEVPLNDNELWPIIDVGRALKNEIFESCITDKTRELFSE